MLKKKAHCSCLKFQQLKIFYSFSHAAASVLLTTASVCCCLYLQPHASLDSTPVRTAVTTSVWPEYGVCGVVYLSDAVAARLRTGCFWLGQIEPSTLLASHTHCHRRQHAGRRIGLVDRLWRTQSGGQIQTRFAPRQGRQVVRKTGAKGLFAGLAATGGRPAVCSGRVAQIFVLALRFLHGDW